MKMVKIAALVCLACFISEFAAAQMLKNHATHFNRHRVIRHHFPKK